MIIAILAVQSLKKQWLLIGIHEHYCFMIFWVTITIPMPQVGIPMLHPIIFQSKSQFSKWKLAATVQMKNKRGKQDKWQNSSFYSDLNNRGWPIFTFGSSSIHSILTRHKNIGTIGELQRTFSALTAVGIHCFKALKEWKSGIRT